MVQSLVVQASSASFWGGVVKTFRSTTLVEQRGVPSVERFRSLRCKCLGALIGCSPRSGARYGRINRDGDVDVAWFGFGRDFTSASRFSVGALMSRRRCVDSGGLSLGDLNLFVSLVSFVVRRARLRCPCGRFANGALAGRFRVVEHGFYAEAFGTPSLFGNGRWPWYNLS